MRRIVSRVPLALALVVFASAASAESIGLYLWKLGEQVISDPRHLTDGPITVIFDVVDGQQAAGLLEKHVTLEIVEVGKHSITVVSRGADSIRERPGTEASMPSFIIDYDEPAISALLEEIDRTIEAAPTPEVLRVFVNEHIIDNTNLRGFDIASKVAQTGSGDCTEYAFLLTALARAKGYPARVVVGVLVVAEDKEARSFGHAWTEIHDGQSWQRFDAALPENGNPGAWLRYLPLMPVINEGPGYTMGLIEISSVLPKNVRLVP